MRYTMHVVTSIALSAVLGNAVAAVSAEEAKQLGGSVLTAFGAERAGNKDGTIPEYKDDPIPIPSTYDPNDKGQLPDPWNDKPLYSITAQNMDKYGDRLSVGEKAMLQKYAGYRIDVYPTRRSARYPKYVLENTMKNATSCQAVNNQLQLKGCYGGTFFPIPKTGNEVVWNSQMAYKAYSYAGIMPSYTVDARGGQQLQNWSIVDEFYPMYDPERKTPNTDKEIIWKLRFDAGGPPRKAGEKYVILDPLDSVNVGRRAWAYIPGQRRVKLAPDLAYDTPSPVSAGASTMDQARLFLGAQDRYDFKLAGKAEKYIMYNNYAYTDYRQCPNEKILMKNYANPDCTRFEVHRVWVVNLTLKPGFRHILPKRTLYFDEDTFQAGTADSYDAAGQIYRVDHQTYFTMYNINPVGNMGDTTQTYDLQTGVWYTSGVSSIKGTGWWASKPREDTYYSPEAMAGEGIR